jgi:2-dehydropantoate 2-reductase
VVAASLAALERDFLLCVREPFDELVVQTPRGILKTRPQVASSAEGLRPVPWVLLATKAHQTAGAGAWLSALADRGTTVAILQNGVEHEERVRLYARDATLLPVVVECRAAKSAPGQVIQRTEATLTVPDNPAGQAFADLFAGGDIAVHLTADFRTAAWRKLCLNVAGGAITALTDRTLEVMHQPGVARLARDLILECVAVGRAAGAILDEGLADEIVASMIEGPGDAGTSLLADRRAGRPLEADARNGAVVRIGEQHGIATPLNRAMTTLLAALNQET